MKKILYLALAILSSFSLTAQVTTVEGKEAILISQKSTCGTTEEGKTRYGMWEGKAYSRVPGEKDRHLFNVVGINTRACAVVDDSIRGRGFKSVSREIMMYLDPQTNEVMEVWKNPWTNEEVKVAHVANDPVNMRGWRYEKNEAGVSTAKTSYRHYGDVAVTSYEIPLFYDNPLGSDYQVYIGGAYHAMEIFNTIYDAEEFTNPAIKNLKQSNLSWSRVAQWLPWMMMGDRAGIMIFNATGYSTFETDQIWPVLQKLLETRYPLYKNPPPLDDDRPNETSWTVFEKFMEGKEKVNVREQVKKLKKLNSKQEKE